MAPANPSTKHHFIPAFYLRRWEDKSSGKLVEFTKPRQFKIVHKQVAAESTGYEQRLYELKGFEPRLAQQVEETFFKQIDTWASNALNLLEKHGGDASWDDHSRSAWSRFVLSLLLRCPEDIALLREWWPKHFSETDPEAEVRYQAIREDGDPETFSLFLANRPQHEKEHYQFTVFTSLVDHENVGSVLNGMHWQVLETTPPCPPLLTSDRPVIRTPLGNDNGHVVLPIGPRLLWIGANQSRLLHKVSTADRVKLVKDVNRQVVEGATRYVWSNDTSQRRFIENRFGSDPQPRVLENVVVRRQAASSKQ